MSNQPNEFYSLNGRPYSREGEYEQLLLADICRVSLYDFVKCAWHVVMPGRRYVDNWHVGAICEHLEAVTALEIRKLIINLPPRMMKSLLVSVFWQAWAWLQDPGSQWIYASYDMELAERDSMRCRDVVKSAWYQIWFNRPFDIRSDTDAKELWRNTKQGMRVVTTAEGATAGLDSDYQVADDPHNFKDAINQDKLDKFNHWWGTAMTTRGNDPARLRRVIVAQRVAEMDCTGHQLANDLGYEHFVVPAYYEPKRYFFTKEAAREAKEKDPIVLTTIQKRSKSACDPRTQEGELAWPERLGKEVMDEILAEVVAAGGQDLVDAIFQQRSPKRSGSIFKRELFGYFQTGLREFKVKNRGIEKEEVDEAVIIYDKKRGESVYRTSSLRFFQTIDTAMSVKEGAKRTAIITMALAMESRLLLWHAWAGRIAVPYQFAAIMALREGPCVWDDQEKKMRQVGDWPKPLLFQAVEAKASGIGLIQQSVMVGKPFTVLKAETDKVARAATIASLYVSHSVFHRIGQPWLIDLENELSSFPLGEFNDQVDALAYGGILLTSDAILKNVQLQSSQASQAIMEQLESMAKPDGHRRSAVNVNGHTHTIDWND